MWDAFAPGSAASIHTEVSSASGCAGGSWGGVGGSSYIVVDPCFRDQFELRAQCATPRYEAVLALLPRVYVGHVDRLPLVRACACAATTHCCCC